MKVRYIFIIAAFILSVAGCAADNYTSKKAVEAEKTVFAMDTVMTLKAYGENAEKALEESEAEIKRLDKTLRRGSRDSEIYAVNDTGRAEVSEETADLIKDALGVCSSTGGAFDISIAPIMDLWGFYTGEYNVPSAEELESALSRVNYNNIRVDGKTVAALNGSEIDLGGIAKGYLSSRIVDIMAENCLSSGIVSLGGNVQTLGKKPDGSDWRVAIQDPDSDEGFIGVISASDVAVITSGGYQRFFEQNGDVYHHIIDPRNGYPAKSGLKSVSIISKNGTLADGLSTALFVMGLEKAVEYWKTRDDFDAVFVTDDNRVLITEGIEDIFEAETEYSLIKK